MTSEELNLIRMLLDGADVEKIAEKMRIEEGVVLTRVEKILKDIAGRRALSP